MSVSVLVEQSEGQFCASPLGMAGLRFVGPSREEVLTSLRRALADKFASGELVDLETEQSGVSGPSGRFRDDPSLRDIRDQIYRDRDSERPECAGRIVKGS